MNETNETRIIMLELGKSCKETKVFRNNTGTAYQSNNAVFNNKERSVTLYDYRVIHAGLCNGSSDLIGPTTITITPEMVGKQVAVFTALEVKTATGRVSPEQLHFIDFIKKSGGIAGVVRSGQQAVDTIKNHRL